MRFLKNISKIFRTHEPCVTTNRKSVPRRGVARDLSLALTAGAKNSFNFPLSSFNFKLSTFNFKLSSFIISIALLCVALSACSDEVISQAGQEDSKVESGEKIYFAFNVTPTSNRGTRATGSDYWDDFDNNPSGSDKMDGNSWENNVETLAVVLTDPADGTVLLSLPLDYDGYPKSMGSGVWRGLKEVEYTDTEIQTFIAKADANGKIKARVCAVVNLRDATKLPAQNSKITDDTNIISISGTSGINAYGGVTTSKTETSKDEQGQDQTVTTYPTHPFLMTNGDYASAQEDGAETKKYDIEIDVAKLRAHNRIDNPYVLNATTGNSGNLEDMVAGSEIPVQRLLSRIDIAINPQTFYFSEYGEYLGSREGEDATQAPSNMKTWLNVQYVGLLNVNKNVSMFKAAGTNLNGTYGTDWGNFWSEMNTADTDGSNPFRYVWDPTYETGKKLLTTKTYDALFDSTDDFGTYYDNYLFSSTTFNDESFTGANNATVLYTPYKNFRGIDAKQKETSDYVTYNDGTDDYYVWTYVTPNTIHDADKQMVSISTGIIFVAQMNFESGFGEGTERNYDHRDNPQYDPAPMYFWAGTPIGTNYKLQTIVKNPKDARERSIAEAYKAALGDLSSHTTPTSFDDWDGKSFVNFTEFENWNDIAKPDDRELTDEEVAINKTRKDNRFKVYHTKPSKEQAQKLLENQFAIYIPTDPQGDGAHEYMCYYYGWLRHNNNNNPAVMGPMEFCVVRNNIYQVKLNGITHIGHPFLDEDIPTDPNLPTPNEPDELTDPWIQLTVKPIDWNVKVNDDIGLGHR